MYFKALIILWMLALTILLTYTTDEVGFNSNHLGRLVDVVQDNQNRIKALEK